MAGVDLYWLGPPQIEVDGRSVKLETRKGAALLALLSVEGRPFSRESLAAMFWPEYDTERAPANLRRVLASVRKSFDGELLSADRDTLQFRGSGNTTVDCVMFLSRIESLRAEISEGRFTGQHAEKLQSALSLYRGEFLEGFNLKDSPEFDRWQALKRDEFRQLAAWALERLAEYNSEEKQWADAADAARRWLELDNLNEHAHRTLMLLYARSGKRNDALRQYNDCRRILREELEQEPEHETAELAEKIRLRRIEAAGSRNRQSVSSRVPLTKLVPPLPREKRVERNRLWQILEKGKSKRLTLISAPAGFGKTTLLSEWVRDCGTAAAWISLDAGDNDPLRFIGAIAAAYHRLNDAIGIEALHMLQAMQPPAMNKIIQSLVDDLFKEQFDSLVIIDDYHLIDTTDVQGLAAQFIEHIPDWVHVYLATRIDPALPLARLRARNQLVEIRSRDLRFLFPEAAAFLKEVMELDLDRQELETLETRTEGWAVGLQMAGLSLQRHTDRARFFKDFGGSHRYIMDYLIGEVLENQPEEIQLFLLRTSILDRFCAPLCEETAGVSDAQRIIEKLDRDNLFLIALDESRNWYRYHHLFAELLQHRLGRTVDSGEINLLHLNAGKWYEGEADFESAVQHYLKGGNYAEALRLIDLRLETILKQGGLGLLVTWAAAIPEEAVIGNPDGCVNIGVICTFSGKAEKAEEYFSRAEELLSDQDIRSSSRNERTLRGQIFAMRAFIADVAGDSDRAARFAEQAEELLPEDRAMTRSIIPFILSRIYRHRGELSRCEAYLDQHVRLALKADNRWSLSGAVHEQVWLNRLKGQLRNAEAILDRYDARLAAGPNEGPISKIIAARGEIEREKGDLESASMIAARALGAAEGWGLPSDICFCLQTALRVEYSAGSFEQARMYMDRIDEIARTSRVHRSILPLYEAERVRLFLALGMVTEALAWLSEYPVPPADGEIINREIIDIARARVFHAAGREPEARELLTRLAKEAESGGRRGRLLQILVLTATLPDAGTSDLLRALEIAEPEGYVRVFLDEGKAIVKVLRELADTSEKLPEHLNKYLQFLLSCQSG